MEAQLRAQGFTLGHFPQSFELSTLGGWIATRSCGQQSLGYGRIERLFAGGHLETPAGSLELPSFPASAVGPDLKEIVLGSEGRFGIITEATMRITPLPEKEVFHAVFLPNFECGMAAARQIVQARLPLSMIRLSTANETKTMLALAGHRKLLGAMEKFLSMRGIGDEKCMLMLGFTGRKAHRAYGQKRGTGDCEQSSRNSCGTDIRQAVAQKTISDTLSQKYVVGGRLCDRYTGNSHALEQCPCNDQSD